MRLERLKKTALMLSPPLWLKARAQWRTIAGKDEAEIGILRFLVPHDRCASMLEPTSVSTPISYLKSRRR
jgi:hypothetical protein